MLAFLLTLFGVLTLVVPIHRLTVCASVVYDPAAAVKWIQTMGCQNATVTNCPGNRSCSNAEYISRALAAGGAIELDPNNASQVPFLNYEGFNLCLNNGLESFLVTAGFEVQSSESGNFPAGSVVFTQAWFPMPVPMLAFATESGRCDSHTPIVPNGPHCDMPCSYFIPRIAYFKSNATR